MLKKVSWLLCAMGLSQLACRATVFTNASPILLTSDYSKNRIPTIRLWYWEQVMGTVLGGRQGDGSSVLFRDMRCSKLACRATVFTNASPILLTSAYSKNRIPTLRLWRWEIWGRLVMAIFLYC